MVARLDKISSKIDNSDRSSARPQEAIMKQCSESRDLMAVYVAPNGSDNNTGTSANPFKSFAKACETVRALDTAAEKTITVRGGSHYDADLALTPADSGTTIKAAPGETPVLYGGHPVTS